MAENIKRHLDETELPEELRELMILWGADDCRFDIKEIADVFNVDRKVIYMALEELRVKYPNTHEYYSNRRQQFRNQDRYEEPKRNWSSGFMNEYCTWEREGESRVLFFTGKKSIHEDDE